MHKKLPNTRRCWLEIPFLRVVDLFLLEGLAVFFLAMNYRLVKQKYKLEGFK